MGVRVSLALLVGICLVLGIARCGEVLPIGGAGRVEIRFWNGFTGPDGRTMLQLVRQFNQSHPEIHVTMQRMDWNTYYNKLMVAGIGGRGPEVFVIHASTLPRMEQAGFIEDVRELFGDGPGQIPEEDFDPQVLEQVKYGDRRIGLPLDIHPQGLYCNAEFLRRAGLVDGEGRARPPETREEFFEAMRKLQVDQDGDGRPEIWGFAYTHWQNNFLTLAAQFGGRVIDEEGRCVVDSAENIEALDFLAGLRREGLVPDPENNAGWIGFRQHRVAMVFDGIYMLGDLKRLGNLEYVAAPIPVIGKRPGTHGDSHVLCVRKGLEARRREAALAFIRYLSDHSLAWADAGQVPARRSVRADPAFKKLHAPYEFSRQVPYVVFPPRTPQNFEVMLEVGLAVEQVIRGRMSAGEALGRAARNIERVLARERQVLARSQGKEANRP